MILHILTDLENAITFSRINILHNSIVRQEEIEWIIDVLLRTHSEQQLLCTEKGKTSNYYDIVIEDAYSKTP